MKSLGILSPMDKRDLPIFEIEQQLLESPEDRKTVGSHRADGLGQSTQVPQMLLDSGCCGTAK